jgi:hypothetical protein
MKDAFGKEIKEGSRVLYSTGGGGGTVYHIGKVVRLLAEKESTPKASSNRISPVNQWTPDKVEIEINKSSQKNLMTKNPLVYASNVVVM